MAWTEPPPTARRKAHNEICTYSKATRNNIEVITEVV